MRRKMLFLLLLAPLGTLGMIHFVGAAEPANVPPPPPIPKESTASETPDDELQPEITITTRNGQKHEEYRVNGRLYQIKVTPRRGAPYYLIFDEQGRSRRSELESGVVPPSWVIKRF
jgi:hypothetical protein